MAINAERMALDLAARLWIENHGPPADPAVQHADFLAAAEAALWRTVRSMGYYVPSTPR